MNIRFALSGILLISTSAFAGPWAGSGPQFKTIKAVAVSPQNSNIVYAGAFGWGVFKSTDAGATWTNARTGMVNTYVRSLLVLSDSLVYAGTNAGIARTTDGGVNWSVILTTPFSVRSIARDPSTGSIYGATYGSGLYKSTNAGATWSQINVNDPNTLQTVTHLWSVAVFGHDSLYVGGSILDIPTGQGGSLFRSVNGGASWFQMQFPTAIRSSIKAIAISPLNAPTRFIMGTAAKGVYLSTNGGSTFTNIDGTGTTTSPNPDPQINTVVFTPTTYYAGGDSLGGAYLRAISDVSNGWTAGTGLPGRPAQINSICVDPGNASVLYLGSDGQGVFKSTNGGTSWSASRSGMMGTSALALTFNGGGKLFLGTDDGDGIWSSADSGKTWGHVDSLSTVDGVTSIVRTASSTVLYCGTLGTGVHKTTDGGVIWRVTDTTVINHFVRSLVVDPTNSNTLYAGTSRGVYKTTNGGTSWFAASAGIPATALVRALDIDAANPSILLAGTDSTYLFRTTNGGTAWTNITAGFLPQDIHIRSITIDQSAPLIAYAGVDSGRVYKTTDGGQSWELLASLPAVNSVRSILIDPSSASTLFAATFGQGIFVSTDAGAHWATYNSGLTDTVDQVIATDGASPPGLLAGSRTGGVFRSTYAVVDQPPVLAAIGNKSTFPNTLLTFNVSATDPDATIPALGASPLPAGAAFVDHGNGQGTFSWTPGQGDIGPHGVVFRASDGTLADSEAITITVLDTAGSAVVSVQESQGWNMVSVPVVPADPRKVALFPAASTPAFLYAGGSYHIADTLHPGDGYWLKFPSPVAEDFGGGKISAETLAVGAGWNMVGTPSGPVIASGVTPLPPVTLQSKFFGYAGGYGVADTLRPGRSYWVKSAQPGQIVLVASAGPGIAPRQGPLPGGTSGAPEASVRPDTIFFTDAEGRSSALLLEPGAALAGQSLYDLPPVPPPGAFDVRFATGRSAAAAGADARILIESAPGPLQLRWSIRNAAYELSEPGPAPLLLAGRGEGSMAHPSDGVMHLRALSENAAGLPARARLVGSFPNPFNPATSIAYELPRTGRVSLKIYDLLGREVAVLADGIEEAGSHTRLWDAAGAASGVYIARLVAAGDAGEFIAVQRLVLMK